jgi:outer membrane protein TolC
MRFEPIISACLRAAAVAALSAGLFASGRQVFASEQTPAQAPPAAPTPALKTTEPPQASAPTGPTLKLTADEAVRMALESNLGIQAGRLGPQVANLGVAQARAAYGVSFFSNTLRRNATNAPTDFTSGNVATVTNETFNTSGGIFQNVGWGGGNYSLSLTGSRVSSTSFTNPYNPSLGSNLNASYTQPLLRDFKIDSLRQQLYQSRNQEQVADLQLRQQITQLERTVRNAYYDLVGSIGGLEVARQSRDLAFQQLKNNQTKVEVGTLAPIDITEAQAELARTEEQVIIQEGQIQGLEDRLRTLIMNPSQRDFWALHLEPTEQPTLSPRAVNLDAAIANALANRTDLQRARKDMESTDISIKYLQNQKLPNLDVIGNYNLTGNAGTIYRFDNTAGIIPPPVLSTTQRSFGSALGDVFRNDFRTWSVQLNLTYPIGTSQAEAGLAATRLQRQQQTTGLQELEVQITQAVREAARQVSTTLKRVEATTLARQFAQRRLEAEEKRMTVGLSSTFALVQAQRDLSSAKQAELNAIILYNKALISFDAVQIVPLGGL